MGREVISVTCQSQQRVTGMWLLCVIIVYKEQGKGSCVWKTVEDSCSTVKANEARGDVLCKYCLCQFEFWRDESDFPLLFLLDLNISEEKERIYNFHSRSKSSALPFGEWIFLHTDLSLFHRPTIQEGVWLEVPYSHFYPKSIPWFQIPKTMKNCRPGRSESHVQCPWDPASSIINTGKPSEVFLVTFVT